MDISCIWNAFKCTSSAFVDVDTGLTIIEIDSKGEKFSLGEFPTSGTFTWPTAGSIGTETMISIAIVTVNWLSHQCKCQANSVESTWIVVKLVNIWAVKTITIETIVTGASLAAISIGTCTVNTGFVAVVTFIYRQISAHDSPSPVQPFKQVQV